MIAHVTSILQSLFSPPSRWYWPGAVAAACVLFALGGDAAREALRWERAALVHEPWRIVTAHLLHLDGNHLILNLAGFAALWALVGDTWRARAWSFAALFIACVIGVGLLASPSLQWYVGLSGVLHGLLVMGAIGLRHEWRAGAALIAVFLVLKTVSEATLGAPEPSTIVAAHWWGIGAGTAAGIIGVLSTRRDQR